MRGRVSLFTFEMDQKRYPHIHFIGIGGVSMSGIAALLHAQHYLVTGSDREENEHTKVLRERGIDVTIGQSRDNIKSPDLVVYTDAIADDNEELIAARKTGVPVVSRGVFLGALMRNYVHSIAVSGSHGKSTTTSMISKILIHTDTDPSILIGGDLDEIRGNVLVGGREYLVTEACEFKANILNYYPSIAVILNIDADHLDFYRDLDHIVETFNTYMEHLDENATAILNYDDQGVRRLIPTVKGRVVTFSLEDPAADYYAANVHFDPAGHAHFDLYQRGKKVLDFHLAIIGRYNIYNALAAIAATVETGIDIHIVRDYLDEYKGLHRRLERVGEAHGASILTDYGHHPTEIAATLGALKPHVQGKLICAFQPHTYSRTKKLMEEFAGAFDDADEIVVTEIYAARERFDPSVKSEDLVERLTDKGKDAVYKKTFDDAKAYLLTRIGEGDVVITTGCGNPHILAQMLCEKK